MSPPLPHRADALPSREDLQRQGTGRYADPHCDRCAGYGVLVIAPWDIPCTTCVWPGLTNAEAVERRWGAEQ